MSTPRHLARHDPRDPTIHYDLYAPESAPRACVLLTHGYAEHAGRYSHVVESWTSRGIAVATYDLRGHGRSGGARGHICSFADYLRDALELLDSLQADTAWSATGKPFLFGHSLGGLVAFHLAASHPRRFGGLLLSSPFFGLALSVPAPKRIAGRIFSKLIPTLALPTGLRGADVTRDPVIADAYDRDPLRVAKATARWFTETQTAQADALWLAPDFRLPVYCLQGAADKVASPQASRRIVDSVASADRSYIEVDGGYHEVLNDPGKEKLIAVLADRMLGWAGG